MQSTFTFDLFAAKDEADMLQMQGALSILVSPGGGIGMAHMLNLACDNG